MKALGLQTVGIIGQLCGLSLSSLPLEAQFPHLQIEIRATSGLCCIALL